jgi:hypothetical protein
MDFFGELIGRFFIEVLIEPMFIFLYKITIKPIFVFIGYLTATVDNKNDLTWDELADIGWSNSAWILLGLFIILIGYISYVYLFEK